MRRVSSRSRATGLFRPISYFSPKFSVEEFKKTNVINFFLWQLKHNLCVSKMHSPICGSTVTMINYPNINLYSTHSAKNIPLRMISRDFSVLPEEGWFGQPKYSTPTKKSFYFVSTSAFIFFFPEANSFLPFPFDADNNSRCLSFLFFPLFCLVFLFNFSTAH